RGWPAPPPTTAPSAGAEPYGPGKTIPGEPPLEAISEPLPAPPAPFAPAAQAGARAISATVVDNSTGSAPALGGSSPFGGAGAGAPAWAAPAQPPAPAFAPPPPAFQRSAPKAGGPSMAVIGVAAFVVIGGGVTTWAVVRNHSTSADSSD